MWSSQLEASANSEGLPGDKIRLPGSALQQLLNTTWATNTDDEFDDSLNLIDSDRSLPYPLTFRLSNVINSHVVFAGVKEFTAEEGAVDISASLLEALGIAQGNDRSKKQSDIRSRIQIRAQQLPKGSYVRLRPLEAGYDPEDWKALLEQYLRSNFTTLTKGQLLNVPGPQANGKVDSFKFLVDKVVPDGEGICIVDTDLEVDIEALNEEQARETLEKRLQAKQRPQGSAKDSSVGGLLKVHSSLNGQVLTGEYVDYHIQLDGAKNGFELELSGVDGHDEVDIFVSPFGSHQRSNPRDDEHVLGDYSSQYPKRLRISPSNSILEEAEQLRLSIFSYSSTMETSAEKAVVPYSLAISPFFGTPVSQASDTANIRGSESAKVDEKQCKNCHQWVKTQTMLLHEAYCYRNNIFCPKCQNVFQKFSGEWKSHWHCEHDSSYGNSPRSKEKHNNYMHKSRPCPKCAYIGSNLPDLAQHRISTCPGRIILCRFCHLEVPQEGDPFTPNAEMLLTGLTPHELADGGRTTECHLCNKIVRLRDMDTHLKHHDIQRMHRPKPTVCRNVNCGRTVFGVSKTGVIGTALNALQPPGNDMGLCKICYGPLYVTTYDPDGKALYRRMERRYLTQLLTGCKQKWCQNEFCKQGRVHRGMATEEDKIATKEVLPLIKPFIEHPRDTGRPLHFCVGDDNQRHRDLAEVLQTEFKGVYDVAWCIAAIEATGEYEQGRSWLKDWAPKEGEALS